MATAAAPLAADGGRPPAPASVDCARGARFLRTIEPLSGVCAVAFVDATDGAGDGGMPDLLVCTPEAFAGAGDAANDGRAIGQVAEIAAGSIRARAVGPLASAADLARSSDGVLAVADLAGRVLVDDRALGEATLGRPVAVAWKGESLLVSDAALGVVVELARDGTERGRFGAGRLVEPAGLAVAPDGSLFVADRLGDCVWRFTPSRTGGFVDEPARIGERGVGPGQFHSPRDVAIAPRGDGWCIVVADELNHRIQIIDPESRRADFFGMHALVPRQGEGRIHYPVGVAVSTDGRFVAVAEAFEDRVQILELKSEPDEVDPTAGSVEYISSHFGGESAAGAGMLAVVDVETQSVALLDARSTPPIHISIVGGNGALPGRFGEISAIAIDEADGRVYIADRLRGRIEVVATDWNRDGLQKVDMFIPRLARGMDLARLAAPRRPLVADMLVGGAAGAAGRMLLLDAANRAVVRCDTRLGDVSVEPLPESARWPAELARGADGTLVVSDPVARLIHVRAPGGAWRSLGELGGIAFVRPTGVAILEGGALVVADTARDACLVSEVGADGAWGDAVVVGSRGGLDEEFFAPESICRTPRGSIVIDRGNHRFQRFAPSDASPFAWNMTGGLGRYYDRKRIGSPGAPAVRPALPPPAVRPAPASRDDAAPAAEEDQE
jgi:DNA-binding beta-propeller fold protein YncE